LIPHTVHLGNCSQFVLGMQLRVHLCFVCSPRHFVYQCCLLLTERRMNDDITSFSRARHCTSAASQHEFRMHWPRAKKPSRKVRMHCGESETHWVDSRRTARHSRNSRSVAIHGRAGHVASRVPRCTSTRARVCGASCPLGSAGGGALMQAPFAAQTPRFGCSWLAADCLRFESDGVCAFVTSICAHASVTKTNARNGSAVPSRAVFCAREGRVWKAGEGMP